MKLISSDPQSPKVSISIPVTEGMQYRFAGVTFSGNNAVPESALEKLVTIKKGAPASTVVFEQDVLRMQRLYDPLGYLGVTHEVKAQLSPDCNATFQVVLNEGKQYRMGSIHFTGLDPNTASKANEEWKLALGSIYDATYQRKFVQQLYGSVSAMRQYAFLNSTEKIDDVNQTVDLTFKFVRRQ